MKYNKDSIYSHTSHKLSAHSTQLTSHYFIVEHAAAAAKSFQSCPTLCDPIDSSPPSSSVPGILQARTLEWVAISFSNAYMHAVTSVVSDSVQPHRQQPTRLLHPQDSLGKTTGVGCHFLLHKTSLVNEIK